MARLANRLVLMMLAASIPLALSANAVQAPAQSTSSPSVATPANLPKAHGAMPAELTKSVDSKKLKDGDVVTARVTAVVRAADGTTIPSGSKLIGHVTEARARSKGDPSSSLGIIFDKISLPDGKELAIKGEIQALASNPNPGGQDAGVGAMGPGMMGGHDSGGSAGTSPPPMPTMPTPQGSGRPVLTSQSKGVVGMRNLELGQNSVLDSGGKEVRLDSGTQMIVQVEFE